MEAADLGYIRKITVRHDNSNLGSDWYLDRVEIDDLNDGRKFIFPCERWLAKKKEDGKIKRSLYEKSYTVRFVDIYVDAYISVGKSAKNSLKECVFC